MRSLSVGKNMTSSFTSKNDFVTLGSQEDNCLGSLVYTLPNILPEKLINVRKQPQNRLISGYPNIDMLKNLLFSFSSLLSHLVRRVQIPAYIFTLTLAPASLSSQPQPSSQHLSSSYPLSFCTSFMYQEVLKQLLSWYLWWYFQWHCLLWHMPRDMRFLLLLLREYSLRISFVGRWWLIRRYSYCAVLVVFLGSLTLGQQWNTWDKSQT